MQFRFYIIDWESCDVRGCNDEQQAKDCSIHDVYTVIDTEDGTTLVEDGHKEAVECSHVNKGADDEQG